MLKPVIAGFLTLHFQDSLAFAALFAGCSFLWDLYMVTNDGFEPMSGMDIGWWWILWSVGVVVSLAVRWKYRRLAMFGLLRALDQVVRNLVVTFLVWVTLTWYQLTIEDPAESLMSDFAVGAVLSWLCAWMMLFALETVNFYVADRQPSEFNCYASRYVEAAAIIAIIIFIDLLAFLDNWPLALLMLGAMLLFVGVGWAFKTIAGAPRTIFY